MVFLARLALYFCFICIVAAQKPFFGASIFLGGSYAWSSLCKQMVDRAASSGSLITHLQFIPTFYWFDAGPSAPPPNFDTSCSNATLSSYYCYSRFNATTVKYWCYDRQQGNNFCNQLAASDISSFTSNVGECVRYAMEDKGFNIAINARVDDGRGLGGWRNTLNFSPTEKFDGQYSYEEAIISPIADILAKVLSSSSKNSNKGIMFIPQGEMGATLFFHPQEWLNVIHRLRQRFSSRVKLGLGINNLKQCGCEYIGIVDAYEYLGNLSQTFDASNYPSLDLVKQLYEDAVDFLGISAYIPMQSPHFATCDFEGLLTRLSTELQLYSISLDNVGQLYYSEYGGGGGDHAEWGCCSENGGRSRVYSLFGD